MSQRPRPSVCAFHIALLCMLVATIGLLPRTADALVDGPPPTLFEQFRLQGDASVAGNTLMLDLCPGVNTNLLPESSGDISGVPSDATIEGAYLYWAGSDDRADTTATLVTPSGASQQFTSSSCDQVPHLDGSYGCVSDVTSFVAANPRAGNDYNGAYTVRGVRADVGLVDNTMSCQCIDPFCQAKFAGWSLVIVYSSPTELTQRDIFLYRGFRVIDEELNTPGSDSFTISGFNVGSPPEATLSFFALEGDRQLGIPPQDSTNCPDGSCIDSIEFNGTRLSNSTNPPGNAYNGTVPGGFAVGVDLDSYDVSSQVNTGDTSAQLRIISGDGVANNDPGAVHGYGEYVIVNWVLLRLNRLAPNFETSNTFMDAVPTQVAPGGTVFYTIQVANDGTLDANNVVVTDALPPELEYVPNSTRVDGTLVGDVGGTSPLASGLSLGTIPRLGGGDNTRRITVEVRVRTGVLPGTIVSDSAFIDADELMNPVEVGPVDIEVIGADLATPTKIDKDLNGGEPQPEDIIEYEVFISKTGNTSVGGLSFTDDISPYVQLIELPSGPYDTSNSSFNGGANGTGFIDVRNIDIPANQTGVFIRYKVQILSTADLIAKGVDPAMINGLRVTNQGEVDAAFLASPLATDDPDVAGEPDPTEFAIRTGVDFTGMDTRKTAVDTDGGRLLPGDTIDFAIELTNNGTEPGTVNVVDDIPAFLTNVTVTSPRPEVAFAPPPAGSNGAGRLTISNLVVQSGTTETVTFTATVDASAPDGTIIQNVAQLSVQEDPGQNRDLTAPALEVFNRPSFEETTKTVVNQSAGGGGFQPGDTVRYTITLRNTGVQTGSGINVVDAIDPDLTSVTPEDGGTFDPGPRVITWNLGDVPPGETRTVHFTAEIASGTANGTAISNQAVVTGANTESFVSDDPATPAADDPTVFTVQALPDLSGLEKTFTDENGGDIEPGDSILYTLTVTNTGRADAANLVITDDLDDTAFDPATITPLDGGTRVGTAGVEWVVGSLPIGSTATVRVRADLRDVLPSGTTVANQGFATADDLAQPEPSDDPGTPDPDDPTVFTVVSSADLATSTKTVIDVNGGAFQPGDAIEYTLTLNNTGNAPAQDLVVTDVVDANLTNVTPLDGGTFDPGTRTITWNLAQVLDPGTPISLRFEATIDSATPAGTVVANQGEVTGTGFTGTAVTDDPNTPAAGDPTVFTVERRPDLVTSTKTVENLAGNPEFRPGDRIRYTLEITNTGAADATNVSVTDDLDTNLTNLTAGQGGSVMGNSVTWTLATLASGDSATLTIEADIVAPLADGTDIANQAFATSDEIATPVPTDDPTTPTDDDPTIFTVVSEPVLELSKTFTDVNGGNVEPGDVVDYSIELTNSGTAAATNVVVTDAIDASLTNVAPRDGGRFDAMTRTIIWDAMGTPGLATLGPGDTLTLGFEATVVDPLANATRVDNQAVAVAPELPEPQPSDDPTTPTPDDPTSFFVVSAADLTGMTKTVSPPGAGGYRPGDVVTYTIEATNTGSDAATAVVVRDPIDPALLTNVNPLDGGILVTPDEIQWPVGDVPAGASFTVRFEATIASPLPNDTQIPNQAFVNSPDFGSELPSDDPATPPDDDPTVITVTSAPRFDASTKVAIDIDGDGFFDVGDRIRYEITVTNDGDAPSNGATVTDPVDTTRLTNITVQNGGTLSGNEIQWTVPPIAAGDSVTLTFEAEIASGLPNGTQIANQAQIEDVDGRATAPTDDPATPADGDPTIITVTAGARLSESTKTVEDLNGGQLQPGDTVRYTLTIASDGTEDATGVVVQDPIDPNLTGISSPDPTAMVGPTEIVWTLGTVPAGTQVALTFEGVVVPGTPDGTVISNQANVIADGPITEVTDDPTTQADDDATNIAVNARPDLTTSTKSVRKLSAGPFLRPGDGIEYTITVFNSGLAPATDVTVSDPIPAQLTDLAPIGPANIVGGNIIWDPTIRPELQTIAPGESVELVFEGRVAAGTPSGTEIANQATIDTPGGQQTVTDDPATPAIDDDPTRITVRFAGLALFEKGVTDPNGGDVQAGDRLSYTLSLTNGPDEALSQLEVRDTLPPEVELVTVGQGGFFDPASRTIIWNPGTTPLLAMLAPGQTVELTFEVRIQDNVDVGTQIANQASVTGPDVPEPQLSDDPRTPDPVDPTIVVVGETAGNADLSTSTKTARDLNGGLLLPGDEIEYELVFTNSGEAPTTNANAFDPIPSSTTYVNGTTTLNGLPLPDGPGGNSLLETGGVLLNSPGAPGGVILPGGQAIVRFRVRVLGNTPNGTQISNQGRVEDSGDTELTDGNPATPAIDEPTILVVGRAGSVVVEKIDQQGGAVGLGERVDYTITVRNVGNDVVTGILLEDPVPEGAIYRGNTLTLNGARLTDAADGDPGEVVATVVRVAIATLAPGETVTVGFAVTAPDEPTVLLNQATVTRPGGQPVDSDDPRRPGPADPTVTNVGDVESSIQVTKVPRDLNGGTLELGDRLQYSITLDNVGFQSETVTLTDDVPTDLQQVTVDSRPAGSTQSIVGNTVRIENLVVEPDGRATVRISGVISDPSNGGTAQNGKEFCNVARARFAAQTAQNEPDSACVTPGDVPSGTVEVTGVVVHDVENNDRLDDDDPRLADYRIEAIAADAPQAGPVAVATSADDGTYRLVVPVGTYFLRQYTERGVQMGTTPEAGGTLELDGEEASVDVPVLIDPQGIVYNSETGEPMSGIQMFVFYDDTDPIAPGELVAPDDCSECANQQGQLTSADGFYRFDLPGGRVYRIEASLTGSQSLQFPSILVPPQADVLELGPQPIEVVDNDLPDLNAEQTYFLRFAIRTDAAPEGVRNNHVPLDPISALISLDKRVDTPAAQVGDVLTYKVTVQNRSTRDIVFDVTNDPGTVFNGAFIQDELPASGALRFVDGSARAKIFRDAADQPERVDVTIDEDAATTGRSIARFGRMFGGNIVGLDLPAGGRIELVYRAVVTLKAETYEEYTNTAALFGTGNVRLSDSDTADVRIAPDPIFDQGVVFGKVFCDPNENGYQDPGERGVFHSRVYLDTGYYANTDAHGKYHFHDVDPGSHQIKIDTATLPPGSTLTTAESRIVYMTAGLPVKQNFGVKCAESEIVSAEPDDEALRAALKKRFVRVQGDLDAWTTTVADETFDLMKPTAWISLDDPAPDAAPEEDIVVTVRGNSLRSELVFNLGQTQGPAPSRWKLSVIEHATDTEIRTFEGDGVPPETLSWDGTASSGQTLALRGGTAYRYHLDLIGDADDFGRSTPRFFLVEGESEQVVDKWVIDELEGALFDDTEPTQRLKQVIEEEAMPLLTNTPDDVQLVIEVHTDDTLAPFEAFDLTSRQATALEAWLTSDDFDGTLASDAKFVARGSDYPFIPNFDDAARAQNRRVIVKHVRRTPTGTDSALPTLEDQRRGVINDYVVPFTDEDFDVLVPRPVDGLLVIDVRAPDGAHAIKAVEVSPSTTDAEDVQAPVIPARLNLQDGTVKIAEETVPLSLDGVAVEVSQPTFTLAAGALATPAQFEFTTPPPEEARTRGWIFEVRSMSTDEVVYRVRDDGEVLARLGWSGATGSGSPLLAGVYEARLTVLGAGAARGVSAPEYFAVIDEGEVAPPLPVVEREIVTRVNGRRVGPAQLTRAGRSVEFEVAGFTGEAFLVDVQRKNGARVVEVVRIPPGFERPAPASKDTADDGDAGDGTGDTEDDVEDAGSNDGGDGSDDAGAPQDDPSRDDGDAATGKTDARRRVAPDAVRRSADVIRAVPPEELEDLPDVDGFKPLRGKRLGVREAHHSPRFKLVLAQTQPGRDVDSMTEGSDTGDATPDPDRSPSDVDSVVDDEGPKPAGADQTGPSKDVDTHTEVSSDATMPPPEELDELAKFGADELEQALSTEGLIDLEGIGGLDAAAADLRVALPPEDMTLPRNELVVSGVTNPANQVQVNGKKVEVAPDGRFTTVTTLPDGESTLVVEAIDENGNRGVVEWPVRVAPVQYFLMAFADTAVASDGDALAGTHDHNSYDTGDVLLYGQARVYFKGRLKGSVLGSDFFEAYEATAHVDTGKKAEFEEMFSTLIQPDEYYPVYGDSAEEVRDVEARGKLYLLVEADKSTYLKFANFAADVKGIQHFNYARSMYGFDAAFDKTLGEIADTEARVFVSGDTFLGDGGDRLRHTYNYMRGTGGSLYYLEHDQVVEGTEQVTLVVKDKTTGVELARLPQTRNVDYTIRYPEGRIIFKSPVSSVADASWMTGSRIHTRDTFEGHPVFVEVGYQYESDELSGGTTWGTTGRETVKLDKWGLGEVSVGAGFIEEGRGAAIGGDDYQLLGVDAAWRATHNSFIEAEYARSRSFDTMATLSDDGGLSYGRIQRRTGIDDVGNAVYARGQLEIADLMETERDQIFEVGGFIDHAEEGFYSNGSALDRGQTKFGGHGTWHITEQWAVGVRNDSLRQKVDDLVDPDPRGLETQDRFVTRARVDYTPEDHHAALEYAHSFTDDYFSRDGFHMHNLAASYEYKGVDGLTIGVQQEAVLSADDERILGSDDTAGRLTTGVSASWQIVEDLALELTERVRWNGENSTRLGLRSQLSEKTSTYVQQRVGTRAGGKGLSTTTVVGGEQRFMDDNSGRAFGEYQIEGGVSGRRNRAVAGLGKTWDVARGVKFDTAYERTQIFGRGNRGESSRDVISLGADLTRWDWIKAGSRFEFRWDEGDPTAPQGVPCLSNGITDTPEFCRDMHVGGWDRFQVVALNNVDFQLTDDMTFLARYNIAVTHNVTLDALEQIDQALSFGFALRPKAWDAVNVLLKYTFLDMQRPLALEDYSTERTQKHVVSVVPTYELPWGLQIINKFAWKRVDSTLGELGHPSFSEVLTDTLLFIFRLNYHLWRITDELTLDVAGEYRFREQIVGDDEVWEHGTLLEASVLIFDHVRVGVGYNFTSFTDNEFADDSEDASGWFFRVQGTY